MDCEPNAPTYPASLASAAMRQPEDFSTSCPITTIASAEERVAAKPATASGLASTTTFQFSKAACAAKASANGPTPAMIILGVGASTVVIMSLSTDTMERRESAPAALTCTSVMTSSDNAVTITIGA